MIMTVLLSAVAYLLGSISSAVLVCKFMNLPDPRREGSMNPGATNVLRIGGKVPALLTVVGDFFKGFLPVIIAKTMGLDFIALGTIALAAFLGHLFSIFFKFQGGKGVATSMGCLMALAPIAGIMVGLCWFVVAFAFRYSSLAAVVSSILAPIAILIFGSKAIYQHAFGFMTLIILIYVLLIWRHLGNIKRLIAGTETKIVL